MSAFANLIILAFVLFSTLSPVAAAPMATVVDGDKQPLDLSTSAEISQEGFLSLSWAGAAVSEPAALQLSHGSDFETIVSTIPLNAQTRLHSKVHISGLVDGLYFARLVNQDQDVLSSTREFQVVHRDLRAALIIFVFGAGLFTALTLVIIRFTFKET